MPIKYLYRYLFLAVSMCLVLFPLTSAHATQTVAPPPEPVCCSNVLFLPGFEASRLYYLQTSTNQSTSTRRGWEPRKSDDVKHLYLDTSSTSSVPTGLFPTQVGDVIDSIKGTFGIYDKFFAMMNGMVADTTINEWLPFAYDWRMNPKDIVLGSTEYATTSKILIDETERLAHSSKTGKVTIVAHSNGGLVAKALGYELDQRGESNLIDKVVLVAVPELGTPQAAAAMLHGDDQALLGGLLLSKGVARAFGLTIPGAYGLLPSAGYFDKVIDPVVTFLGSAISSYDSFVKYLTGKSDNRNQPQEKDMKNPAVLYSQRLSQATSLHSLIDSWKFPSFTEVLSLVGWGTPTTQSLDYADGTVQMKKDTEGDGTVIVKSASAYSGENGSTTLYFNQASFNKDSRKIFHTITHPFIFDADPVNEVLRSVVDSSSVNSVLTATLPKYISHSKPGNVLGGDWLEASVHSPVDMDIYGSHGGHMGAIPFSDDEDGDLMIMENTLGGVYDIIGDEKYYTLPADDTYTIRLKGTGTGTFTFQVKKLAGDKMIEVSNTVYADLPVTPLMVATTTINSFSLKEPLKIDVDGNGTSDIQATPSKEINPLLHLEAMKTIILSLHLDPKMEKSLLQKIEKIRKILAKGKNPKISKTLSSFEEKIDLNHWDLKNLTKEQRTTITGLFSAVLSALDTEPSLVTNPPLQWNVDGEPYPMVR